jgi:hypothetical protein
LEGSLKKSIRQLRGCGIWVLRKKQKRNPYQNKRNYKHQSRERALNENVMGMLKRFKILAERYRNRRKRFCLKYNLIAGIYNWEL